MSVLLLPGVGLVQNPSYNGTLLIPGGGLYVFLSGETIENDTSSLPAVNVALNEFILDVEVTENNYIDLSSIIGTIGVSGLNLGAESTENNLSEIISENINLLEYIPQSLTGQDIVSQLNLATIVVNGLDLTAKTTDIKVSTVEDLGTIEIVGNPPTIKNTSVVLLTFPYAWLDAPTLLYRDRPLQSRDLIKIDSNHPLAMDEIFIFTKGLHGFRENRQLNLIDDSVALCKEGVHITADVTSNAIFTDNINLGNKYTLFIDLNLQAFSNYGLAGFLSQFVLGNIAFYANSDTLYHTVSSTTATIAYPITLNKRNRLVITRTLSGAVTLTRFYINGKLLGTSTASLSGDLVFNKLAGLAGFTFHSATADIYGFGYVRKALTVSQAVSLSRDPYQSIEAANSAFYYQGDVDHNKIALLPKEQIVIDGLVPQIVAEEDNDSNIPLVSIDLQSIAIQTETTEYNLSTISLTPVELSGLSTQTAITEYMRSEIASVFNIDIAGYAPDSEITEDTNYSYSNLDIVSIDLASYAPTTEVQLDYECEISLASINITNNVPQAITTEKHLIVLPQAEILVQGYIPDTIANEDNTALLTRRGIYFQLLNPTASIFTDNDAVHLPKVSIALDGLAPTISITDRSIADLPTASIDIVSKIPTAYTGAKNISQLGITQLDIFGNTPSGAVYPQVSIEIVPINLSISTSLNNVLSISKTINTDGLVSTTYNISEALITTKYNSDMEL